MKLFWKLFCSMVLITALACSAGGCALIDAQFRSSLDREVSGLFAARSEQYRSFFSLMLTLTAAVGILSLFTAKVLLRPLDRLSAAARRMAEGDLDQRVQVRGDDETAQLSAGFNLMAHRVQRKLLDLIVLERRGNYSGGPCGGRWLPHPSNRPGQGHSGRELDRGTTVRVHLKRGEETA